MCLMALNFACWQEEVCSCISCLTYFSLLFLLGSLFIVAIAAAAGLRPTIRGLSHDIILRINYLLRCPNTGMISTYVTHMLLNI